MSTFKTIDDVIREIENWIRLSTLLHSGLHQALLAVLHNTNGEPYNGLPQNPKDLFKELNTTHLQTLLQLKNNKKKKILSDEQWDKLFPVSGETDSETLDITLLCILIINCTTLPPPNTGWDPKKLLPTDICKAAGVLRGREWRNYVNHTDPNDIDNATFQTKWREGEDIIKILGYQFNSNTLKKISLDPKTTQQQQLLLKALDDFCKKEVNDHDANIKDHDVTIANHAATIKDYGATIKDHGATIKDHGATIKDHGEKIKEHNSKIREMQKLIKEYKDELKNLSTTVTNLDKDTRVALQNQQQQIDQVKVDSQNTKIELKKEVDELKKSLVINVNKETGTNVRMEEKNRKESKNMAVVVYVVSGCIFKMHVTVGDVIQSVKIKCVSSNHDFDWLDVEENEDSIDDETVSYGIKNVGQHIVLLKLNNLKEFKKYKVMVQTDQDVYRGDVTICGHSTCTHVTQIKKSFTVLSLPLGQPNDPQNCHNGLQGFFIDDVQAPTISVSNGVAVEQMNVKEFIEFCHDYFTRNFHNVKLVQFPPPDLIANPMVKEVASLFMEMLSSRGELRAVLTNLDFIKCLRCCRNAIEFLQMDVPFHNRIMVFDERSASIINIRVIEQTNFNDKIYEEMMNSAIDAQCLVSTYQHHSCCCYIVTLLAFPNLHRDEVSSYMEFYYTKANKHLLDMPYLSKEDLHDTEHLQNWWNTKFEFELKRISQCKGKFDSQSFEKICGQAVAAIALAEVSPKLPTLQQDSCLQIKSLLLNAAQMEAIETPSNRRLIEGGFGTGKSVVLDEITKKKFRESRHNKEKTLLLSVVWESYSLLEFQKKWLLEKLTEEEPHCNPNLTTLSGNVHDLWRNINKGGQVTLLKFLQYYLGNSGYRILHIIIDELPTNCVHFEEVRTLNQLLTAYPKSSITIAPQSVMIKRITSTKKWEKYHNQNCLNQIEFDRFKLMKVMRNTRQLTAVLKASQEKLHGTEAILSVHDPETDAGMLKTLQRKMKTLFKPSAGVITRETTKTTKSQERQTQKSINEDSEANSGSSSTRQQYQVAATPSLPPIEFGKISKVISSQDTRKKPTSHIKTIYKFHKIQNGNGVEDRKPTLIKLPLEVDLVGELSAQVVTLALNELCLLKEEGQTLILCSGIQEVIFLSYCLSLIPNFEFLVYIPQIQGTFLGEDERLGIYSEFNNGKCLLTDNTGIKGMEAKRVVIFAGYNEYHERFVISETLSRANVLAYLILHSPTPLDKNKDQDTLGKMFENLGEEILHVENLTLSEDKSYFDEPFSREGRQFRVNATCLSNQEVKQTFSEYKESFLQRYPVKQGFEDYRTAFKEVTSFQKYEIVYEIQTKQGKKFTFKDVYQLLIAFNFDEVRKMFSLNRHFVNNLRDDDYSSNQTLLIMSCWSSHHNVTRFLLEEFRDVIDVMAVDNGGDHTAYHYAAAMDDNVDDMKRLLSFDRSGLNVQDGDGLTPLHHAAHSNLHRVIQLLLDEGCDVDIRDRYGRTADQMDDASQETKSMIEEYRNKTLS